ncbi:MAG: hypothetical protein M3495_04680, partial [Pseudomonadota bacterium]|nr:hypothetical protein [Pseudomonadota bacterium]
LSEQGFGLLLARWHYEVDLCDYTEVAEVLKDRSEHHQEVRRGSHRDSLLIREIKDNALAGIGARERKRARPDIWPTPPYTLSFFYAPQAAAACLATDDAIRCTYALLEPSQVLLSDTEALETTHDLHARAIESLNCERFRAQFFDIDLKAGVTTFASWAGLVVFDEHQSDLLHYESLEIRLQFAWLRAHFIRQWAELVLRTERTSAAALGSFAIEMAPIIRQARRLIDASVSTRDQQLFDQLVVTSDLKREADSASEAVDDVREFSENLRNAARRKYDLTVELLLFIVALLQGLPLLYDTPLLHLPKWTSLIILGLAAGLGALRLIKWG